MSVSPEQAMQQGLRYHRAGQLSEAETIYRDVLAQDENNVDALHLLGVIAHQVNRDDVAEPLFRRAIEIAPLIPDFHNSLGQSLQTMGRVNDAIDCYLRAIAMEPNFGDAFANLGIARRVKCQWSEAIAALQQAAVLDPNNLQVHLHLAAAHMSAGNVDRAVEVATTATQIDPTSVEALSGLAAALQKQQRLEAAVAAARQATRLRPDQPRLHYNLGLILQQQKRQDEAIASFLAALRLRNDDVDTLTSLATSLHAQRRYDEAIAALGHALQLRPNVPETLVNLGAALQAAGRIDEATAAFSQAVTFNPDFAEAHNNLGLCLLIKDQFGDAITTLQRAIELDPSCVPAHGNLGVAFHMQGRHIEAIGSYLQALSLRPQFPTAHSNILMAINYESHMEPQALYDEHVAWAKAHVSDIAVLGPAGDHNRDPDRRLRIGYVSADLRHHVISFFMEPLFEAHDHTKVEVFCYSGVTEPDATTNRLRALSDHWVDIPTESHEDLAERIRRDRIDILIDLTGHQVPNRLQVFARKPAPVQVTYLGYPNTTGLSAIDYRITDAWADPVDVADRFHSEKLWRLPRCAWCFKPIDGSPDVAPPPADAAGHITFGSFNKFSKLSPPLLAAWKTLLDRLPQARLLIKSMRLVDDSTRQIFNDRLRDAGIPMDRCEVLGKILFGADHLAAYGRMDIALDAYPYHGTTTTCDALYMGVPVITLAGDRHAARVGVSLLNAVGVPELIAESWDDYIAKAVELANDRERLRRLRSSLRPQMTQSPLMNGPDFARAMESAYRQMWRTWCST